MTSTLMRKTVRYRCGCEVELSLMGNATCGIACAKHGQPIQRVTTVEEYA